jgi:hypothetical protein
MRPARLKVGAALTNAQLQGIESIEHRNYPLHYSAFAMSSPFNESLFFHALQGVGAANSLGATERPLDAYAPCWCKSGKKWKFCHKTRQSEKAAEFGEIMSLMLRAQQQWVNSDHSCLHPNASPETCSKKVISSHTVQRNGGLSEIAENQHVLSIKKAFSNIERNGGELVPELVGLRSASTFPGFCNAHDTEMFRPVEEPGAQLSKENVFLLSYRAIGYEYVMKQYNRANHAVERDNMDRGHEFSKQVMVQNFLDIRLEGVKRALGDIDRWKARYVNAYNANDYSNFHVYGVTFDSVFPFVASGAFMPEYDLTGIPLQKLATSANLDELAINVTVLGGVTVASFGWWGDVDGPSSRFVHSFATLPDEEKAKKLAVFVFEHLENVYVKPSWWESRPQEEKNALLDLFKGGLFIRSPSAFTTEHTFELSGKVRAILDLRPAEQA